MKNNFEERRKNRIENAKKQAQKNAEESDRLYQSAHDMASHIPFGQPILVGHHSEKRDRRYRQKIHDKFGKSFEMDEKAKYYADKAETIESNNSIFSDDPQALDKLKERVKSLQQYQDFMKATNKCIKKKDRESFLKLPNATPEMWEKLSTSGRMGYTGFAHFSLTNNNAKIKRLQMRITSLENQQNRTGLDKVVNGIRIFENMDANRLQMFFDGKPDTEVIKALKSHGFRWSPSQQAWQRHISPNARYNALQIAENISQKN